MRAAGFERMDISTWILEEPKLKRLARLHPDLGGASFTVFVAVLAASWREGQRQTVEDAWPSLVPFDPQVTKALRSVGLIDRTGRVAEATWESWYGPARDRREANRERWRRWYEGRSASAIAKRGANAEQPRTKRGTNGSPIRRESEKSHTNSVQTPSLDRTGSTRAHRSGSLTPLREAMERAGLKLGQPDQPRPLAERKPEPR